MTFPCCFTPTVLLLLILASTTNKILGRIFYDTQQKNFRISVYNYKYYYIPVFQKKHTIKIY